ncbi:MAG: hypothetical protein M3443_03945 [Actinomycetota bacterium]|nr:hypothetical protein [Actinomycetota bacterium]
MFPDDRNKPWQGGFAPPQQFMAPAEQPPKRRRGLWIALAATAALLIGGTTWLVIETSAPPTRPEVSAADADLSTRVAETSDGLSRVTVPAQWVELPESVRADGAVLSVGQYFQERYLMVITKERAEFTDFVEFEETALDAMDDIAPGAVIGQPSDVAVGPLTGVRYEVSGTVGGIDVVYWFTLVEGDIGYHQVITWTLPDRRSTAEPALHDVVSTFEEVG